MLTVLANDFLRLRGRCTPDIAAPIMASSRTEASLSQGIPTRHDDLRQLCLEQLCHDQHPGHSVLHSGQDREAHIISLAHRSLPSSKGQVWCTLKMFAYHRHSCRDDPDSSPSRRFGGLQLRSCDADVAPGTGCRSHHVVNFLRRPPHVLYE